MTANASTDRAREQRREAEARLAGSATTSPSQREPDAKDLVHELQVHQVELEIQNEELRQAQRALEASRDRFRVLYDKAPFGYVTLDSGGKILEANPTAAALLGVAGPLLYGRTLTSFMRRKDAEAFYLHRLDVLSEQPSHGCEVQLRRGDGTTFPAHLDSVSAVGWQDERGRDAHFYTAIADLSALRTTEQQLRESERHFREITERIEDVFYVRDRDGVISYVSSAYERIWRRSSADLIGSGLAWLETVHVEDRQRVAAAWTRMREGSPISEIYRIARPDGTIRWVHSRAFPVRAPDGRIERFVGVVRDITVERRLEMELRQAQKMEAVGTLASGVAHNLRNMLQALMLFIEIARKSEDPAHVEWALGRAHTTGKRGSGLIDQLMIFARKQEGEPTLVPLDVDTIVRDTAVLLHPMIGDAIVLAIESGAPHAVVLADVVELEQVLLNLASNARDAMPRGGTLTIASAQVVFDQQAAEAHGVAKGPYVELTVRDTGSGMDDATRARIFEPFFTTKDVDKGTGLGLSTVFGIVHRLHGCIEVASKKGEGTAFTIYLPSVT